MNSFIKHSDDRYRQPRMGMNERHTDYYPTPVQFQSATDLMSFVKVFRSRIKLISGTTIGVVFLALLYIWTTTPLYNSTTELLIDPRRKQTVDFEVSPSGLGSSAVGGDTLLLDSQIEVLNSQSVIDRLITSERLMDDTEFATGGSTGITRLLKNLVKLVIYGPHDASRRSTSLYDQTNRTLRKRLSVERRRNTYVISINMLSSNADKSARIANNLASIYIDETNNAASRLTREVATNLDQRLLELRTEAQRAELAVETYRTKSGLIRSQNVLTVEQQLRALTDRLSQAKADSQVQLATYNQIKAAGASQDSDISAGAATSSKVMSNLLSTMARLNSQEADLLSTYLPKHPRVKRLQDRKQAIKKSLEREFVQILARLNVQYKSTLETVESLSREVSLLEGGVANSNSANLKLRQLEREAEANRVVYQSFLTRSKEAAKQIGLPNSTARIISTAYPSSRSSFPKPIAILAGSLVIGIIAGLVLAWASHIFGDRSRKQHQPERRMAY